MSTMSENDVKAGCIIACAAMYNQFDSVEINGMPEVVRLAWQAGREYTEWVVEIEVKKGPCPNW